MSAEITDQFFNLSHHCLHENARVFGQKTAIVFYAALEDEAKKLSYAKVEQKALQLGTYLCDQGLPIGARIFIKLRTGPAFVAAFFGAIAVGMVPVPLSPLLSEDEIEKYAKLVAPDFMFLEPGDQALLKKTGIPALLSDQVEAELKDCAMAEYAKTTLEDIAFMVLTSGTASEPKIVAHGHRVILGRQPMRDGWTDIGVDDRVLHAGALNWTYSLGVGLLDVFCSSATALFYTGKTEPNMWPEIISRTKASIFAGVPSLYRRILKYGDASLIASSHLRHGLCAGEPLPAKLHQEWVSRCACPLFEALGMSEISTYISSSPHITTKPGSPGKPQAGRRVCVLPIDPEDQAEERGARQEYGVLAVHGSDPGLMLGTYVDGEFSTPPLDDGWFVTGDLARIDEDGYVWYEGRMDDVMNVSGYRVSPAEIEAVLLRATSITDIAVKATLTSSGVSLITAHIVTAPGCSEAEASRDIEALSANLAQYKRPKQLSFVSELPRTRNGKIRRSAL